MRESIFSATIRVFLLAFFGVIGLILGVVVIAAIVGASTTAIDGAPQIDYKYTPEILANAKGVRKELSKDAPVILQLNIKGVIGLDNLTQHSVGQQLLESRERVLDDRVKAILLYIDSPGGTVVDADGIYREIKKYKEIHKTPVYAYVDGLCASGGMYIASAADKIYASETSLVGSVGVILPSILNFSQLLDKVGVQSLTLYDGKGKDNLNPLRPWVKGEEDNIKNAIDYYYGLFVNVVTSNRPQMDKTKLIDVYGANVYPAVQAQEFGYIDESNANLQNTLKLLAEKIDIKDDYYQVVSLENKSWLSQLFKEKFELFSGHITHQIELTPDLHPNLMGQYLYLYRP